MPTAIRWTYSATLADGSALPTWLHFDPDPASFVGTPDDPDLGTIDVKVRATDPSGEFAEQIFRLTVTPVNDAPVANDDTGHGGRGGRKRLSMYSVTTAISKTISCRLWSWACWRSEHGSASLYDSNADGIFDAVQYTPDAGYTGPNPFTYQIDDGNGGRESVTVNVTVTAPDNVAPVANDDPVETGENTALEINLADLIANDTDGNRDPLTVIGDRRRLARRPRRG